MRLGNLEESVKGFLWGVGFAVAGLGLGSAYAVTWLDDIEWAFRKNLKGLFTTEMKSFTDMVQPEVLAYKVVGNQVWVASKAKSFSMGEGAGGDLFLRITLLGEAGAGEELLATCRQDLVWEDTDSGWTYYETQCDTAFGKPEDVEEVRIAVGHAGF